MRKVITFNTQSTMPLHNLNILDHRRGQKGPLLSKRSLTAQKVAFDALKISNLFVDDNSISPTVHDSFSSIDSSISFDPSGFDDIAQQTKVPAMPFSSRTPSTTFVLNPNSSKITPARSSLKKHESSPRSSRLIETKREIEIQLPGAREPIRRKSYIGFVDTVQIKRVRPVDQLVTDPQELWFQRYEYELIRRKASMVVNKVENGMTQGKKYCARGLEGTMKGTEHVMYRNNGWEAVLTEQYRQTCRGIFDEERIAKAYRLSSRHSQLEAVRRAALDQVDSTKYYSHSDK